MTVTLFAQPYNLSAEGFYFDDVNDYRKAMKNLKDDFGEPVEEVEIQFIESEDPLDCALFKVLSVSQGNVIAFLETALEWEEWEKVNVIIATGEVGYSFDIESDCPDHFGITIYHVDSLKELAEEFVNDGLFGDIPDTIAPYLDMDAIARGLSHDYTEIVIAGSPIIYRAD